MAGSATINYAYDEAGRLVQVQNTSGSAQYRYDTAGNLTSVLLPSSAVGIADISPNAAPIGATVTIIGSGFSSTPSADIVKFNGVTAPVTSASPTRLVVSVPSGAATGLISVTVGASTATSASVFGVSATVPDAPPTVSGLSTQVTTAGSSVTVSGANFFGTGADLWVRVNGQLATITSVTATQIVFTVPTGGTSGNVEVGSRSGVVTQGGYLYVPPSGSTTTDIGATTTISVDGAPVGVVIPAGKKALVLFDAQARQALGLGISTLSTTPSGGSVAISVYSPDGSLLANCPSATATGNSCDIPLLPSSDTYAILITPSGGSAANLTLTLSADVGGTLTTNAAPLTFNTSRIGQNARFTFRAAIGDNYSVNWSGATFAGGPSSIGVYEPDGNLFASAPFDNGSSANGTLDLRNLPDAGVYSVRVSPFGASIGQVNVGLNATGTLVVDGTPTLVNLIAAQSGYYNFSGRTGQTLGLGVSSLSTTPTGASVAVSVLGLDGSVLVTCPSASAPGNSCNLPALPSTGRYTVVVTPASGAAASLTLTLSSDAAGTLLPNAPATPFNTTRVGQNARYTFNATAGQNMDLLWSGSTFAGTWSYVYIYQPDGTQFNNTYLDDGTNGRASGTLVLSNLPATGNYTVFVDPQGASTGGVSLQLLADAPGSLAIDGAPLPATLPPGQNGNYTFNGTVGQTLGLGISAVSTSPASGNIAVSVISPDNVTILVTCGSYTASGGNCNLPALPSTGAYTVRIVPQSTYGAALTLTLSSDVAGTLTPNALASQFSTTRVGQNARYTFNATAGQNVDLQWSGSTFAGTWSYVYIYKPDGTQFNTTNLDDGTNGRASGTLVLSNLPATGNYTVFVDPYGTSTGSVSLRLLADAPGSLAIDGAVLPVSLLAGQNGDYTFNGTVGQTLGLGISALSTSPANGNVNVSLIAPDNVTTLISCGTYTADNSCNLPALPSSGAYTVRLVPQSNYSANVTLTLSNDVVRSLTPNAAATPFSTTRVGQNARFTFNATAGQSVDLLWSGSTFAGTWSYLYVYKPDGTQLTSANFDNGVNGRASGTLALSGLAATGSYTVFVDPYTASTGAVALQVLADAPGSLAIDGAPLPVSLLAGQNGDYTFNGSVGQTLGLGISALSTSPASGNVTVSLIAPDNLTTLLTCGSYTAANSCNLPVLPSTGTYTVHVVPQSTYGAALTLTLSNDVGGTLIPNAAVTQFSTARLGQNARYTFSATAAQNLDLLWSGSTFAGTWSYITVYQPDGTALTSSNFDDGANARASGTLALTHLQQSGTYTVFVDPFLVSTGAVNLQLLADAPGSLAIDGAALPLTLSSGQNGDFTFNGTVGQTLGLGISAVSTSPASGNIAVSLIAPDNVTILVACGSYTASGGNCNLPALPSSGTYTVRLVPQSTYGASLTLTLSNDAAGTLIPNAAATQFSTTRVGQNARYTFNATAGQNVDILWSGGSFAGIWSYLTVYQPDGSQLNSTNFDNGANARASGTLTLTNLPASGTYTVFVDPYGTSVGAVSLGVRQTTVTPPAQESVDGSLTVDGTPTALNIGAGSTVNYTFSGALGQKLGLGINALSTSPSGGSVTMSLIAPDNVTTLMTCGSYTASGGNCNLPMLPSTGTYTVRLVPQSTYGASLTLTLSNDAAGTLIPNAAATQFSTTRVGQNARYTFNATAGQNVDLLWSGGSFAGTWSYLTIYKPDGSQLTSTIFDNGVNGRDSGSLVLANLPASGVYTVFVDPYGTSTGAVSVRLLADAPGSLAVDGAALAVTLLSGQNGTYTFSGTVGQKLGLGVSTVSTSPVGGNVTVSLMAPDGVTTLMSCGGYAVAGGNCNLPMLPSTGTYTVRLVPQSTYGASLTLTLSNDVAGILAPNAAATQFSTPRVGQNARYTFNATAGQNVDILWSGGTFAGTWSYLTVYKPDGGQLTSTIFDDGVNGRASGILALTNLPATGNYTVFVDPYGTSTGGVSLQLLADAPGSLAIDGAALPVNLLAGQNGAFTFTGALGQTLGLGISALSTSPANGNVSVSLIASDNVTTLMTCGSYAAAGGNCNLPALPSTGNYTLRVVPTSTYGASLTLTLSSDISGTLAPNAAATSFSTSRIGQNARFTFSATAGHNVVLQWSGSTFAGIWSYFTVYKPDGSQFTSTIFDNGVNGRANGTLALTNLPATGTYAVFVDPFGGSTGAVGLQLLADASGVVAVDGAPLPVTLLPGQNGGYTFNGTVGQTLGLGVSALSTSPAAGNVSVSLIAPDNVTTLMSCGSFTASGGNCNLPVLPSTGSYAINVVPQSTYGAALTLTLSSDAAATLIPNAAATTFSTTRIGQNARYTFSATAGQNLNLLWSGGTFAGAWSYITIYKPNGAQLSSSNFDNGVNGQSTGTTALANLPATGTYTVFVDPYGVSTGSVRLQVLRNGTAVVPIDGASLSVALAAGQNGDYTFAGTVGQRLGLGVSSLLTTPASGIVTVSVIAPDKLTTLITCGSFAAPGDSCNLPALPSTGTYTVRVVPQSTYGASLTLTLSSDAAGSLAVNSGGMTFTTARVGQNARLSFTGVQGGVYQMTWNNATFAGSSTIHVYAPNGTDLGSTPFGVAVGTTGTLTLSKLASDGVYTVFIDPVGTSTGQVSVLVTGSPTPATDGDVPLPPWALVMLAGALLAGVSRQRTLRV